MGPKSDATSQSLRLLEAILFIAERPISFEEIKQKLLIKDDQELSQLISSLKQGLEKRHSFVEIIEGDQGQAIQMRLNPAIKQELDTFRTKKALSKDFMQTLSYIALKQPLKYSDLRNVRGQKVKEHVEALEKEGFIKLEPSGKTNILTTTLYFASVFNLDPERVKEKFKDEMKKRMLHLIDE
jgi:chromosome segregation and condensation protein ScpB